MKKFGVLLTFALVVLFAAPGMALDTGPPSSTAVVDTAMLAENTTACGLVTAHQRGTPQLAASDAVVAEVVTTDDVANGTVFYGTAAMVEQAKLAATTSELPSSATMTNDDVTAVQTLIASTSSAALATTYTGNRIDAWNAMVAGQGLFHTNSTSGGGSPRHARQSVRFDSG